MELLLINNSKLKVILTEDDMSAYSLTCDNIDYDNTETRRAFWCILDEAKHRTGFDAASDKIFIQVYPSKKGGCEMFVTKLSSNGEKQLRLVRKTAVSCDGAVCRFDSLSLLLSSCRALMEYGFSDTSDAWRDGDGKYYLGTAQSVSKPSQYDNTDDQYVGVSDILGEFGVKLGKDASDRVREHCTRICVGNAVETLSKLA